jgi:hypothetical protein
MTQRATRLKSVNHASFKWRNQFGQTLRVKPPRPTVQGRPIHELTQECQERIKESRLEDIWTPVVKLFLSMARVIQYDGDRAQSIWRDYCAGIYGKNKSSKT